MYLFSNNRRCPSNPHRRNRSVSCPPLPWPPLIQSPQDPWLDSKWRWLHFRSSTLLSTAYSYQFLVLVLDPVLVYLFLSPFPFLYFLVHSDWPLHFPLQSAYHPDDKFASPPSPHLHLYLPRNSLDSSSIASSTEDYCSYRSFPNTPALASYSFCNHLLYYLLLTSARYQTHASSVANRSLDCNRIALHRNKSFPVYSTNYYYDDLPYYYGHYCTEARLLFRDYNSAPPFFHRK